MVEGGLAWVAYHRLVLRKYITETPQITGHSAFRCIPHNFSSIASSIQTIWSPQQTIELGIGGGWGERISYRMLHTLTYFLFLVGFPGFSWAFWERFTSRTDDVSPLDDLDISGRSV